MSGSGSLDYQTPWQIPAATVVFVLVLTLQDWLVRQKENIPAVDVEMPANVIYSIVSFITFWMPVCI